MGGSDSMGELELGAFRPSPSDLFVKDNMWVPYVLAAGMLWFLVVVLWPMMDDGSAEMAGTGSGLLVVAVADSVFAAVMISWRYRRAKNLSERGIVTRAEVTRVTLDGAVGIEYVYVVEGKRYTKSRGGGMSATSKKMQELVGKEIVLLVDPVKPEVHLLLSKLG